MLNPVAQEAMEKAFVDARTVNGYTSEPVTDEDLRAVYDLMKWGPTSTNQQPLRIIWCRTQEAKDRLAELCYPGNAEKVRAAPVAAILGMEHDFVRHLPRLFPHMDATGWYGDDQELIRESAFRNSSLQAGYLIIAARMLGLALNPMSGFDADAVNEQFFGGTSVKVNFITTLGHGDVSTAYPRGPRLTFEEANSLA